MMTKTALVSGGRSGIGAAIAVALARRLGMRVVAAGLPAPSADPPAVEAVDLDVRDPAGIARLVAGLDRLDVLVNAAGIIRRSAEHDPDVFAEVVDVNLVGMMRLSSACRDQLSAAGGSIVNIASMLSLFGSGVSPGYSASKGGVVQLTKSLAIAWAPLGIRVNAVLPGWIRTDLTRPLQEDAARERTILARTPMGRWGEPADVVGPVLFLAGPDAAFVTGATLAVDGGYAAM
jgi:NAD(P)-dependent dehydrogenase (short-subunit alcohol dehydrogenase family)